MIGKPPVRFTKVRTAGLGTRLQAMDLRRFCSSPRCRSPRLVVARTRFRGFMSHLALRGRFIVLDRLGRACADRLPTGASYLD